jgi:hypothetical protein
VAVHLDPRDGLYRFLPATARVGADFRLFATGLAVPSANEMGPVYLDPVYL